MAQWPMFGSTAAWPHLRCYGFSSTSLKSKTALTILLCTSFMQVEVSINYYIHFLFVHIAKTDLTARRDRIQWNATMMSVFFNQHLLWICEHFRACETEALWLPYGAENNAGSMWSSLQSVLNGRRSGRRSYIWCRSHIHSITEIYLLALIDNFSCVQYLPHVWYNSLFIH